MDIRLDDIGAASKQWERWSRHRWANFWPAYNAQFFGAMAPYRELTADEIWIIAQTVHHARRTIVFAVTPLWVEANALLVPYPEKFPQQAAMVKTFVNRGIVEVAQHGSTHCIPGQHLPRWFGGNRRMHRETLDHISEWSARGRQVLESWLGREVRRFVAPGFIEPPGSQEVVFHDRQFVLHWSRTLRELEAACS